MPFVIYENNCRGGPKQKFLIRHNWILSNQWISDIGKSGGFCWIQIQNPSHLYAGPRTARSCCESAQLTNITLLVTVIY